MGGTGVGDSGAGLRRWPSQASSRFAGLARGGRRGGWPWRITDWLDVHVARMRRARERWSFPRGEVLFQDVTIRLDLGSLANVSD